MKNRTQHKLHKIRSLHDLEIEKSRLKQEVLKREGNIKDNYRNIVAALTFRNLLQRLSNEISVATSAVSTAFSIGKTIFSKLRKKKKNKDKASSTDSPNTELVAEE